MVYRRRLGKSNIEVSALGMGCWGIGGPFKNQNGNYLAYGDVDDKESIRTVQKAIELGVNLFDTADVYGCGHSEEILGKALKGHREDVVVGTKFGSTFNSETKTTIGKNTSPEYINNAIDDSLRRLQTEYIDIYQLHNSRHDSEGAIVIRETLEKLVDEGKIHYYGWSTDDPVRAKEFAKGKHCLAIQYILNILRNNTPMAKLCEKNDLAGIIRQPIQSGILSGKYAKDTKRASNHFYAEADFTTERYRNIFSAIEVLKDLLVNYDLTMIQASLGYIWAKNKRAIPIPGAKTIEQIIENAKTLEYGPISQKLMNEIDSLFIDLQNDFSYETFPYYKSK